MTLIIIKELPNAPAGGPNAAVSFDHGPEYPITIHDPFSEAEEKLLAWYFEEHLRFPFTRNVQAQQAASSITSYGEELFKQIFAERAVISQYGRALSRGVENLHFEIAGSPEFHRLHWEAIKDPDLPRPFSVEIPIVRKNLKPTLLEANMRTSPTLNVLIVTARPGGKRDVGYRTISRPLVDGLEQAGVPVRIDILRPGTYRALEQHLQSTRDTQGSGFYHIVHFDVHGSLMNYEQFKTGVSTDQFTYHSRYGRDDIEPYPGVKAFLFLEGNAEHPSDPVEALLFWCAHRPAVGEGKCCPLHFLMTGNT